MSTAKQMERVFEFVETKGLLAELEIYMKATPEKQNRYAALMKLVGGGKLQNVAD